MFLVRGKHFLVVHAIQLVAREYKHIVGVCLLDKTNILRYGIGSARIPGATRLRSEWRQNRNAAAAFVKVPRRTRSKVRMQQIWLILCKHANRGDTRVCAVGQRKIDNTILAAKGYSRLCDFFCKRLKSASLTSGKKHGNAFSVAHG